MAIHRLSILTPWRRNHSIIFTRAHQFYPLGPPVAICIAAIAKTGNFLNVAARRWRKFTGRCRQSWSKALWIRGVDRSPTPMSRFQPMYRLRNLPPTPRQTLERARTEAQQAGLEYVYIGNLMGHEGSCTYCPRDGTLLVRRTGFWISEYHLTQEGRCPKCQQFIPGVWP